MALSRVKAPKQLRAATTFLGEVRRELAKVVWPTRRDTIRLTVIVVSISVLIAFYIGLLDIGFTKLVDIFIIR